MANTTTCFDQHSKLCRLLKSSFLIVSLTRDLNRDYTLPLFNTLDKHLPKYVKSTVKQLYFLRQPGKKVNIKINKLTLKEILLLKCRWRLSQVYFHDDKIVFKISCHSWISKSFDKFCPLNNILTKVSSYILHYKCLLIFITAQV